MIGITIAEYFPARFRHKILPQDWEACLEAWILICHELLISDPADFAAQVSNYPSISKFLTSYIEENAMHNVPTDAKSRVLRSKVYRLIHRLLSEISLSPSDLLTFDFLSNFSLVYQKVTSLSHLLDTTWKRHDLDENRSFKEHKATLVETLESHHIGNFKEINPLLLLQVAALQKSCSPYNWQLTVGSDLLGAFNTAYYGAESDMRKKLRIIVYRSLIGLLQSDKPRVSVLLDHLYALDSASEGPLLEELCSQTPLLRKIRAMTTGPDTARANAVLEHLSKWEKPSRGRVRKPTKGKARETEPQSNGISADSHVHQLSLVTQIQDIFPDLGTAFVTKLLDEYNENVEKVTSHLLEDSLPDYLKNVDRSENLPETTLQQNVQSDLVPELTTGPKSPHPPKRRNIFDGDDFSRLAISPSQLSYGRATDDKTNADTLLNERTPASSAAAKAAIWSALAAIDPDDDERDDTYDVADVGGTVDTTMPGSGDDVLRGEDTKGEVQEETLFSAWKASPEMFGRDTTTRRSQARSALKEETGMSDEMIEGWASMLNRDPGRLRRLAAKYSNASVMQRELGKSSWQATDEDSEDVLPGSVNRGRRGHRGRGRGGRGNVAGSASDQSTQQARQRKDQNKGARANHNRRDQRARKMGRGGFPG